VPFPENDLPDDVLAVIPADVRAAWEREHALLVDPRGWDEASFLDMHEQRMEWVRQVVERGVPLLIGTDFAMPWCVPGYSFHRELATLALADVPPEDLLVAATKNGAEWLGIDDRTGTLLPGKEADLVVLGADPLADIANVGAVELVVSNGVVVDPDDLLGR
jgi:imidazolonepropionase-like amidohydrolase